MSQANLNACSTQQHSQHTADSAASSSAKWICKKCTYSNWPRSLHCVQCYVKRNTNSSGGGGAGGSSILDSEIANSPGDTASAATGGATLGDLVGGKTSNSSMDAERKKQMLRNSNNIQENLKYMRINSGSDSELHTASSKHSYSSSSASNLKHSNSNFVSSVGAVANRLSPIEQTTTTNTTQQNNLANTSQPQQLQHNQQRGYVNKWACNVSCANKMETVFTLTFIYLFFSKQTCTYENWPKSLKCSMCGKPKEANTINNATFADNIGTSSISGSNKVLSENDENVDAITSNNSFNKKHIYQLGKQHQRRYIIRDCTMSILSE